MINVFASVKFLWVSQKQNVHSIFRSINPKLFVIFIYYYSFYHNAPHSKVRLLCRYSDTVIDTLCYFFKKQVFKIFSICYCFQKISYNFWDFNRNVETRFSLKKWFFFLRFYRLSNRLSIVHPYLNIKNCYVINHIILYFCKVLDL